MVMVKSQGAAQQQALMSASGGLFGLPSFSRFYFVCSFDILCYAH